MKFVTNSRALLSIEDETQSKWAIVLLPHIVRWGLGRERIFVHGKVRTFGLGPVVLVMVKA